MKFHTISIACGATVEKSQSLCDNQLPSSLNQHMSPTSTVEKSMKDVVGGICI